jgi:HK97 family phage portal protein
MDACQFKKAMVLDMLLGKGGYAYVNKVGGKVKSIHYVEENRVSFWTNSDPIFKDYKIQVHGKVYEGWKFIKLLRNTKNGYDGTPITEESALLLSIIHNTQKFEENLVKTGGNKKGFLETANRLSKDSLIALKNAFKKMYSNNTENVIVLNDGVKFQEASNTSVELQLNENKKTNAIEVCKVFQIPPTIIEGGGTEEDRKLFHENCIIPLIEKFNNAINSVLLTEDEKSSYFFAFDDTDLTKGDIEKRFRAYEIACKNGFMQLDEVRRKEKFPAFGLDFIKLGLQDVLYYPSTNEIYTPNTNQKTSMNASEGGEIDAS